MRMKEVRAMLTDAILAERERCAGIADRHERYWGPESDRGDTAERIAADIRSANPPHIQVVRPETAVADPSKVTQHTIVAGQGLVGDEIVDRFRMQAHASVMERAVTEMRTYPDPKDRIEWIQPTTGGKFRIEDYSSK